MSDTYLPLDVSPNHPNFQDEDDEDSYNEQDALDDEADRQYDERCLGERD